MHQTLKRVLFYTGHFTWGLAVNAVGALICGIMCIAGCARERYANALITYIPSSRDVGAMSLGVFLFVSAPDGKRTDYMGSYNAMHEYGHAYQVLFLGPFYWIAVGIPSLIWATCFGGYRRQRCIAYSALYCETWADRLGERHAQADEDSFPRGRQPV